MPTSGSQKVPLPVKDLQQPAAVGRFSKMHQTPLPRIQELDMKVQADYDLERGIGFITQPHVP